MDVSGEPDAVWHLQVPAEAAGERLDRYLPSALGGIGVDLSRALLQNLIKEGRVTLNGNAVKPRHAVTPGDLIVVSQAVAGSSEPLGEAIDISILYEDEEIIVVNKQSGLVVHPASGNLDGTLVNALLHHCGGKLSRLAGEDRPGIVHRLDKDTSGCLVAAKSDAAYLSLVAQFSERETGKEYLAVTDGVPAATSGTIANRIGRHPVNRQKMAVVAPPAGKEAVTDFEVIRSNGTEKWASLRCVIHTGRTHQIRVHLKESLRCPILGDPIYSQISKQKTRVPRLMLHARFLTFRHPVTGGEITCEALLPEAFLPFL
jgi:23S rRNA pseudouridine1911/1915/1917 synthase